MPTVLPVVARRLMASLFAGILLVSLAGPAAAALPPFDPATLVQAESDLGQLVNTERSANGLIALRLDPEAMAIARQRAATMAANDRLSHDNPDGTNVFDAIVAAGIPWQGAGEVIVRNNYASAPDSTGRAVLSWMASPTHRAILLSRDYNYAGFGAAVSPVSGNRYYAGVVITRPDLTVPWVKARPASSRVVDASRTRVTVRWTGGDPRLQVLTAGVRDYEIQRRVAGGSWRSLGWRTGTSLAQTLPRARTYEFRIRARDRAGNRSPWAQVTARI